MNDTKDQPIGYRLSVPDGAKVTVAQPHPAQHVMEYWDDKEGAVVRVVGLSNGTLIRSVLRDE